MKCFCVLLSGWRYGRIIPGPHAERHHRPAQQDQSGQLLLVSRPPIGNISNNIINNNNNILGKTESVGLVHCVHLYGFIWEKFSKVVRWQHFSIFRNQVILDKLSLIGRPDNGFTSVTGCATFSLFLNQTSPISLVESMTTFTVIPAGIQLVRYENEPFTDRQVRKIWPNSDTFYNNR